MSANPVVVLPMNVHAVEQNLVHITISKANNQENNSKNSETVTVYAQCLKTDVGIKQFLS
ncbi:MAG TPA: hypothetical protein VH415_11230 [Nitrososphaeraceae archaeon]